MNTIKHNFVAKPITQGPKHHFFGYYDILAWNRAQTHHLVLETDFHERAVEQEDQAIVALVETTTGDIKPYHKIIEMISRKAHVTNDSRTF